MALESLDDYYVIKKCLNGEKECFSHLVNKYKNLVYSVVFKMVNNAEDASDLSQEIFIKVYKNLDKYHPEFKFSTWIVRISTNHIIDYRRKKKYDIVPIEEVEYRLTQEETPETDFIMKEESLILNDLINDLPDIYRVPIVLYHKKGLSYQEIADTIDEPLSKVKNRIFRGRKILKEEILKLREGETNGLQRC